MKRVIENIKTRIAECMHSGEMFGLPQIDIEGVMVKKESLRVDGATLYHDVYDISSLDGATIHIDYRSKD